MPGLFWERALQQIVPGISFLHSFVKNERLTGLQDHPSPCSSPATGIHTFPGHFYTLPPFLHSTLQKSYLAVGAGRRGWQQKSQDYHTHASLPCIAHRFPSEPWVSKHPNKLLDGSSKWHKTSNAGRGTNHHFCAGKPPHKSLEEKGGVWGRFHSCWFL